MATLSQKQQQPHSILHIHNSVAGHGMPHGLGLLTTVASLPPKYRSRYLSIKTKCEIPLDLSVKPEQEPAPSMESEIQPQPTTPPIDNDNDVEAPEVPIATSFAEVYTEPSSSAPMQVDATEADDIREAAAAATGRHPLRANGGVIVVAAEPAKPITPPPSPTKRPHAELSEEEQEAEADANPAKQPRRDEQAPNNNNANNSREVTPTKPIRADSAPKTAKAHPPAARPTKNKATRKLKFDEETSSPVSGTIIRPLEDITDGGQQYSNGDIDPKYNIVEITEETKAELAAIRNVIGDYICRLCRIRFDDAFGLARHRCACIVLLEYRCPECGKQFNCPANLASHRRWHKPKKDASTGSSSSKKENRNTTNTAVVSAGDAKAKKPGGAEEPSHACDECGRKFKRQAYLRKHQLTHASKAPVATATTTSAATNGSVSSSTVVSSTSSLSSFNSYAGSVASTGGRSTSSSSSSASSQHSYSGAQEDEGVYTVASGYDYDVDGDVDSMSECSTSSGGYGRLQIVESGLTEEENIAAAALTNLRNCASVIQHTTLAH